METEPGARDRMREREQWWPRSDHDANQSDVQSPRVDEERSQPGVQSPRSDRSPSQPDQPLRSYKQ
jgi:hypothetical protein